MDLCETMTCVDLTLPYCIASLLRCLHNPILILDTHSTIQSSMSSTASHESGSLLQVSSVVNDEVSYLITLRSVNEAGPPTLLSRRLISLHPGGTSILGRLSKNQKMEYMAKSTNGYFDNPIISRCHALLENRGGEVTRSPLPPVRSFTLFPRDKHAG